MADGKDDDTPANLIVPLVLPGEKNGTVETPLNSFVPIDTNKPSVFADLSAVVLSLVLIDKMSHAKARVAFNGIRTAEASRFRAITYQKLNYDLDPKRPVPPRDDRQAEGSREGETGDEGYRLPATQDE